MGFGLGLGAGLGLGLGLGVRLRMLSAYGIHEPLGLGCGGCGGMPGSRAGGSP